MSFLARLFKWRNRPPDERSRIKILYRAADNEITSRVITIGATIPASAGLSARVVAYCHLRGEVRTFRLDRILASFEPDGGPAKARSVNLVADVPAFRALVFAPPPRESGAPFGSIAEAYAHYRQTLADSGWVVQTRSEAWSEYVGLHRRHRRGAGIMKGPSVQLGYEPIFEDVIGNDGAFETVPGRSRDRPWTVFVVGRGFSSYDRASAAANAFEEAAADEEIKRA